MADIETRIAELETKVTSLDEDMQSLPDLIKTEARFTNSQIARLSRELSDLQDLPAKVDALPRVIAEIVQELLAKKS